MSRPARMAGVRQGPQNPHGADRSKDLVERPDRVFPSHEIPPRPKFRTRWREALIRESRSFFRTTSEERSGSRKEVAGRRRYGKPNETQRIAWSVPLIVRLRRRPAVVAGLPQVPPD